jgi:hypothetical protein
MSNTYGSVVTPTNLGSGGYAQWYEGGGGALQIRVTGQTALDGIISANGGWQVPGVYQYGQGSGGSVWLRTGTLTGSGTIEARGGSGQTTHAGGGGGGRIAVILSSGNAFGSVTMRAWGGTGIFGGGAAGTVYRETAAQGAGKGELTLDNNGLSTLTYVVTHFPPLTNAAVAITNELANVSVVVTNRGRLGLLGSVPVGDLTVGTNSVLDLNLKTLTVNHRPHWLGHGSIITYGQILWNPPETGVLLMLR